MLKPDAQDFVMERLTARREWLRVAVVTETYPPEINGVSLSLARVVEQLHSRNHDIQLFRPRQGAHDAADREARFTEVLVRGVPVPKYPSLRMGLPSKRTLVKLWSLHRPDVVHIATEGPLGWSALQAAAVLKLPVTSDFRTNFDTYSRHYGLGWLHKPVAAYLRKFHNRTQCTMVPTQSLKAELASRGYRNLEVVMRGVDTERFHPARRSEALRASWGVSPDQCVVACVSRLAPEKNIALVVRAYEEARRVDTRVRLLLVGDGPHRAELQRLCPTAIFAGERRGNDLADHYASADVFAFASLSETFGNVVPEAMASGLPVVAFDHAAAAELLVDQVNGIKVHAQEEARFTEAVRKLCSDVDLRHRLAQRSLETARTMDWNSIGAQFESVLARVVREHAAMSDLAFSDAALAR
ncbi:MAG: glycosyltransferase family 1 protein [Betaproteobacteria bacterium]|jgi:glycosyltransferase involved in cell wall biosynthesis|nr:glycosyltransferase family 1 protein [Betaproteobacteria bacterium]